MSPARTSKAAAAPSISGPSTPNFARSRGSAPEVVSESIENLASQQSGAEEIAAQMPYNRAKPGEIGADGALTPPEGQHVTPPDEIATASTAQEDVKSAKLGVNHPQPGVNARSGSLDEVRIDSGGRPLTTNQGVLVSDNQNSLKAGIRGPSLLEDFILREKITHFDHERIPERVVHARGSRPSWFQRSWFLCRRSAAWSSIGILTISLRKPSRLPFALRTWCLGSTSLTIRCCKVAYTVM